jgi:membrane-associated phospholipid phosphatase
VLHRAAMALPLFVNSKNKHLAGAAVYAIAYLLYALTNRHPIFAPHLLPMSFVDSHVPFVPATVLIYTSEYFFFAFVYFGLRDQDNLSRYLYAFFFLQVASALIFLGFPTIYPRGLYPIPDDLPGWLHGIWIWLRKVDRPTNCFPSLHVSSVFLSALAFRSGDQKKLSWVFLIWAGLIALSTLTTKQHYLADILSGAALALIFHYWFQLKQSYRPLPHAGLVTN